MAVARRRYSRAAAAAQGGDDGAGGHGFDAPSAMMGVGGGGGSTDIGGGGGEWVRRGGLALAASPLLQVRAAPRFCGCRWGVCFLLLRRRWTQPGGGEPRGE